LYNTPRNSNKKTAFLIPFKLEFSKKTEL